jgi:hypothetical protein
LPFLQYVFCSLSVFPVGCLFCRSFVLAGCIVLIILFCFCLFLPVALFSLVALFLPVALPFACFVLSVALFCWFVLLVALFLSVCSAGCLFPLGRLICSLGRLPFVLVGCFSRLGGCLHQEGRFVITFHTVTTS